MTDTDTDIDSDTNSDSESTSHPSDCFIDWTGILMRDRYILIKRLDYGSYASVWIAYDIIDKLYYAIKIHNRESYDIGKRETYIYEKITFYDYSLSINPSSYQHILCARE